MSKIKYVNLRLANNETLPKPLTVSETFSEKIIDGNAEGFEMTVMRFTINLSSLPIMFFPKNEVNYIEDTNSDPSIGSPDNTRFYITVLTGGTYYERPVQFRPQSDGLSSGDDGYLSVRSFQHFIDMINKTIYDACQAGLLNDAPYFVLDEAQNRVILYAKQSSWAQGVATNKLFMNRALYRYFRGLNATYFSQPVNRRDYEILIRESGNPDDIKTVNSPYREPYGNNVVSTTGSFITLPTEPQMLGNWVSIKNVLFTTNLPVQQEMFNEFATSLDGYNGESDDKNVLVDFEILREGPDSINLQGPHTYNVSSEFRMASMIGGGNLNTLSLSVFYQDKFGHYKQVFLEQDDYFSCKLMFRKRDTQIYEEEILE